MLLNQKRLNVVLNPFSVPLDHKGRPCANVLYDPAHSAGQAIFIGTKPHRVVTEKREFRYAPGQRQIISGGAQQDRVDTSFEYDLAPTGIEDTRYHRKMIVDGTLLPADEKTARTVGVAFADPEAVIAKSRAQRIEEWEAQHGEKPDMKLWKVNVPTAQKAPKAGEK